MLSLGDRFLASDLCICSLLTSSGNSYYDLTADMEYPHSEDPFDVCFDLSINKSPSLHITELTLVVGVITQKTINYKAITSILNATWDLGSNVKFQSIETNILSFMFLRVEDRVRILNSGPWAVKGSLFVLNKWLPNQTMSEIDM